MRRQALFILGMHRSGTSLAAGLARLAGVDLGGDLIPASASDNPKGFWEHRALVSIDELLLRRLGLAWFVPEPLPPDAWTRPDIRDLLPGARAALRREFADRPLWGLKDPRLCRLLPFWAEAADDLCDRLRVLFVFRHPLEVADSLAARDRMPTRQALLLWLVHTLDAVLGRAGKPDLSLSMESLLADPVARARDLRTMLEQPPDMPADATEEIKRFVEPALRHQRHCAADPRLETAEGRLASACHAALERLAAGEDVGVELSAQAGRLAELTAAFRKEVVACGGEVARAALAASEDLSAERLGEMNRLATALARAEGLATDRLAEVGRLDRGHAEAQRISAGRLAESSRLTEALAAAEVLAAERLAEIRTLDTALAHAQRIAADRLAEIRARDVALADATRLAEARLAEAVRLDTALAEAQRIAGEQAALAAARGERLAAAEAALARAETLALERLAAAEALDRQLRETAAALAAVEDLARARLAAIEELSRRVEVFTAGLAERSA